MRVRGLTGVAGAPWRGRAVKKRAVSQRDCNHYGRLPNADPRFSQFKVMVTQADGARLARTLTQRGITEIDLRPDVTQVAMPDGSRVTGRANFVISGVRRAVADMVLMAEVNRI